MWSVIYNVSACDPNELDSILETDELTAFRFPFRSHNFKIKELTCEIHLDAMATGIYNNLSCQWNFIGGKLEIYYRSPQNDIINVSLTIPRRDILR